MTPHPLAVDASLDVKEAQRIMIERNFRHLPVVEGERLVGVVSDRDILLALLVNYGLVNFISVGDTCGLKPYIVTPDTPLADVLANMAQLHIGSALVAENGKLLGIYTATDACRHLARSLAGEAL